MIQIKYKYIFGNLNIFFIILQSNYKSLKYMSDMEYPVI